LYSSDLKFLEIESFHIIFIEVQGVFF